MLTSVQIKDIKVQIEDENSKIDSEYNGELSLISPDKDERLTVPITNGRGTASHFKNSIPYFILCIPSLN